MSWAAECLECWLIRNVREKKIDSFNSSLSFSWKSHTTCTRNHITFSHYLTLLAQHRFLVRQCKSLPDCVFQKEAIVSKRHPCWTTKQRVISMQVPVGILGSCLNLMVVLNILLTKSGPYERTFLWYS